MGLFCYNIDMTYNHPAIHNFALLTVFMFGFSMMNKPFEEQNKYLAQNQNKVVLEQRLAKPKTVRGIYLTANSAGSDKYRAELLSSLKDSKINSVVIDIKDYSGYILYNSELPELKKIDAIRAKMKDTKKLLENLLSCLFKIEKSRLSQILQ
jgi:hypothetical protein